MLPFARLSNGPPGWIRVLREPSPAPAVGDRPGWPWRGRTDHDVPEPPHAAARRTLTPSPLAHSPHLAHDTRRALARSRTARPPVKASHRVMVTSHHRGSS